jgi:hypothetical protein
VRGGEHAVAGHRVVDLVRPHGDDRAVEALDSRALVDRHAVAVDVAHVRTRTQRDAAVVRLDEAQRCVREERRQVGRG